MKNKHLIVLAVFLLSTILVVSAIAIAKVLWTFEMKGVVVQYGLYVTYPNGTLLSVLDFGEMERDKNYTKDVVVHNNGTTKLILNLSVPSNNWTTVYSSITWNRESYALSAGTNVTATITWEIKSTAPLIVIPPIPIKVEGS